MASFSRSLQRCLALTVLQTRMSTAAKQERDNLSVTIPRGCNEGCLDKINPVSIGRCAARQEPLRLGKITLAAAGYKRLIQEILLPNVCT